MTTVIRIKIFYNCIIIFIHLIRQVLRSYENNKSEWTRGAALFYVHNKKTEIQNM